MILPNGHVHQFTMDGRSVHGMTSASQAVPDIDSVMESVCEVMEEELLKMRGHIVKLQKYIIERDGIDAFDSLYPNDDEGKEEIRRVRLKSQGFLSEDDMKI